MTTRTRPRTSRRLRPLSFVAVAALTFAACSSDDSDTATDATDATDATTEETAAAADESTTSTEAAAEEAPADTAEEAAAPADGAIPVELGEFFITLPDGLTAGTLTFAVDSVGEFPHALAIARGSSYEDLQLKENGAVDIDALGADYLGTTENLDPGVSTTIDFELEAGDYVFFCPIEFGDNSHAANGQVLSVTVG